MTIMPPQEPRPPHLRKKNGVWWCSDVTCCGMGPTPRDAHRDWQQRGKLIRAMHRCEQEWAQQERAYDSSKDRHGGYYGEHGST